MFKRDRLGLEEAKRGLEIFKSIPLRYIEPDFVNAVSISKQTKMYAYDAYFLDCALRQKAPLLTFTTGHFYKFYKINLLHVYLKEVVSKSFPMRPFVVSLWAILSALTTYKGGYDERQHPSISRRPKGP